MALKEVYRFVVQDLDCYVMQDLGITQIWDIGAPSAFLTLPNGELDLEACKAATHGYCQGCARGITHGRREFAATLRNMLGAASADDLVKLDGRIDGLAEGAS